MAARCALLLCASASSGERTSLRVHAWRASGTVLPKRLSSPLEVIFATSGFGIEGGNEATEETGQGSEQVHEARQPLNYQIVTMLAWHHNHGITPKSCGGSDVRFAVGNVTFTKVAFFH